MNANTNPKITLTSNTIDSHDYQALSEWLKTEPRLSKGDLTIEFEKQWAEKVGTKHAVFVNSGSSANLLILYSLICAGSLKNKKICVPAVSWITTVSPCIQFGLEPILIDCNMDNLAVDLDHLETVFKEQSPAALILVSVLGMVPDMDDILYLCKKYDVYLLGDFCEALGSEYNGQKLETYPLASSCSMFYSHQLCTIEGGMITTNETDLYRMCLIIREHGWTRSLDSETTEAYKVLWDVSDFESLYKFYEPGFNVRSTDLQAFIGLRQLEKLDMFVFYRNAIYNWLNELIKNVFWKPREYSDHYVSCLGYPIISPNREKIVQELLANGVECRPLIAGSMGNQPFWIKRYGRVSLHNADIVDKYGFYVPCHPFLTEENIQLIASIINNHTH